MKQITFTNDEIRILLSAIEIKTSQETIKALKNNKNPSESNTIQRLNAISKKAYNAIVEKNGYYSYKGWTIYHDEDMIYWFPKSPDGICDYCCKTLKEAKDAIDLHEEFKDILIV